ncbi:nucleolar protein 56 [Fistulifera solaris]|uniref:Nucleolar protein 56 n=1 Tax=Fistulifera solaris TaxID=1519565 RepID=A0A1Z5JH11_FISSO|nr:nucleolar protein 56 [Fistulifera solaris]|eukprot:GAX13182.1 nucleolar protein 56 [Fistulifera solaris]
MADATSLFTLYESAAGYALFEVVAMEEITGNQDTLTDINRFGRAVKLKAFHPFASASEALENANAVSEHAMSDTLKEFLQINMPKPKKSSKTASVALGVIDPGLATAISSGTNFTCRSDETIREICRGSRLHLEQMVKGLQGSSTKAQLGLGHAYSRSKVKFNPARSDNMIIQSIALLDQLDKDVNSAAMRVREWYSWHFPELKDVVSDNIQFARVAACVQDKQTLLTGDSKLAELQNIVQDEETVQAIVQAAKTSMGMACSDTDMLNIVNFTQRMIHLAEYRKQLSEYLQTKMNIVAPNLSALIGDTVAARLISKAGSLTNLAKSPASTVQILGAEKALFRALKTKGNTPKYGLIYHSTFIGRADAKNKGRISRYLANKCSIATRIDSFSDVPNRLYGEKLREQVEERLKFYETGQAPRKNLDVMQEVARELHGTSATEESAKKKKKDKKRKSVEADDAQDAETPSTKKRKSSDDDDDEDEGKSAKKAKKEEKKKKKDKKRKSTE